MRGTRPRHFKRFPRLLRGLLNVIRTSINRSMSSITTNTRRLPLSIRPIINRRKISNNRSTKRIIIRIHRTVYTRILQRARQQGIRTRSNQPINSRINRLTNRRATSILLNLRHQATSIQNRSSIQGTTRIITRFFTTQAKFSQRCVRHDTNRVPTRRILTRTLNISSRSTKRIGRRQAQFRHNRLLNSRRANITQTTVRVRHSSINRTRRIIRTTTPAHISRHRLINHIMRMRSRTRHLNRRKRLHTSITMTSSPRRPPTRLINAHNKLIPSTFIRRTILLDRPTNRHSSLNRDRFRSTTNIKVQNIRRHSTILHNNKRISLINTSTRNTRHRRQINLTRVAHDRLQLQASTRRVRPLRHLNRIITFRHTIRTLSNRAHPFRNQDAIKVSILGRGNARIPVLQQNLATPIR